MAKRNKRSTRRRLAPTPVKAKGTPLPAETRARLAFKLAQARGELLSEVEVERDDARAQAQEAETRLQRHRRGGRPMEVNGEKVQNRAALAAEVWKAVQDERARHWDRKNPAIYAAVNEKFERSKRSSWAYQLYREHERTLTKK